MTRLSVTQNFSVRIIPVNNPLETNEYGEQKGYYSALVTSKPEFEHEFFTAEQEWMRGIVPSNVGYGNAGNPEQAIAFAFADFVKKFGDIAVAHTENLRW